MARIERNAPAAGIVVYLTDARAIDGGPVAVRQTTGANGDFSCRGVPDGRYRLSVTMPPERGDVSAPAATDVTVTSETACVNVDVVALDLAPLVARPAPPITVTGKTVAPPGIPARTRLLVLQPLDGLATARAYGGTTAEDGSFSIRAHRGVRYRVLVEEGDTVVGRAEFVAGDAPVEIRLEPRR